MLITACAKQPVTTEYGRLFPIGTFLSHCAPLKRDLKRIYNISPPSLMLLSSEKKGRNIMISRGEFETMDAELAWTQDSFFTQTSRHNIILLDYGETPYFLRGNPYITSGYRAYLSFRKCLQSLFIMTNETINIWTHILGFLIFFSLTIYSNFVAIPNGQGKYGDHIVFSCYLLFYQFCMISSAGYHLFNCHSEKMFHCWLALDLAGISLALCGCYIPGVYYAFYCQPTLQVFYLAIVAALSSIALLLQLHPKYFSSLWASKRLASVGVITVFGFLPIVHWTYIYGGFSEAIVQIFLPKVITMYILGALSISVYALKFPESCFPGKLNYIGGSHQWWHILVVLAFCWWYSSSIQFFNFRQKYGCLIDNPSLMSTSSTLRTSQTLFLMESYT